MKKFLLTIALMSIAFNFVRSDDLVECNKETEDCVKFLYCNHNFTSHAEIVVCGKEEVCCIKKENILNTKIPSCGINKFDKIPLNNIKLPWSAKIEENGKQICIGTLISSDIVLTLAECVTGKDASSLSLSLGSWITGDQMDYHETREVKEIIQHPDFVEGTMKDNIALLFLKTQSSNHVFVNNICLPFAEENFEGKSCVLLGFEDKNATKMNVEDLKVTSCKNFPKLASLLPEKSICTEKNSEMTFESVGAGLACKMDDLEAYALAGVFRHGNDFTPSDFLSIVDYREWIDETLNKLNHETESYVFDPTSSRCYHNGYYGGYDYYAHHLYHPRPYYPPFYYPPPPPPPYYPYHYPYYG